MRHLFNLSTKFHNLSHMTNRQIISIIILLLCAVAFYIMPMQIDDGEVGAFVGASLMPTLAVSLIVVFVSFDLILSVFLNDMSKTGDKAGQGDVLFESSQISSIVIVIGLLSLFGMFLIPAGYVLASTALLAGLMFLTGGRQLVRIFIISLMTTCILYMGLRFGFGVHINAFPTLSG